MNGLCFDVDELKPTTAFLGQCFHTLQPEHDTQTNSDRTHYHTAFAGGNNGHK